MGKFGWSLPPGCGKLPGEEDEQWDNSSLKEAFGDYSEPFQLYKASYDNTDCGITLGVQVDYYLDEECEYPQKQTKTIYNDDLYDLGTWDDMNKRGELITAILVSSIVEGVDWDTDTIVVNCKPGEFKPIQISDAYWKAVENVEKQAKEIWDNTHGCDDCPEDPETGYHIIDPNCKTCHGEGTII